MTDKAELKAFKTWMAGIAYPKPERAKVNFKDRSILLDIGDLITLGNFVFKTAAGFKAALQYMGSHHED